MVEFEKYEMLGEIGRGGVAIVYKARHKLLGTTVAIKVLNEQFTTDEEFIRRFINGARSAACLKHPNIIPVFDVGDEKGAHYIVMEYLEGETLKDRIERDGPFQDSEIERIMQPLGEALDYAHRNGVIHRDLKSSNVFMRKDGRVVLMDFDIAKASDFTQQLTRDGSVLGTPAYMSPEQANGEKVDYKSDIYSFGVIMYEMATGEVPFKGENLLSILRQINMEMPRPPCEIRPSVSKKLQKNILWCMEKSPEDRPDSIADVFAAKVLESILTKAGVDTAGTAAKKKKDKKPPKPPSPRRKAIVRGAIFAALAVIIVGSAAFWPPWDHFRLPSSVNPTKHYTGRLPSPKEDAADLSDVAKERSKNLYDAAMEKIKAGNIDGAIAELETIRDFDPGSRLAQKGMQKIYDWHVRNAEAMFKKKDLRGYCRYMDRAVSYFPEMKLDNLYQRGSRFGDSGMLLAEGEANSAAVYKMIIQTYPDERRAAESLKKDVEKAVGLSFTENKHREKIDLASRLASDLPGMAGGIYEICGDLYYTNNILLTRDRYNAASMYTRALKADSLNEHSREQLRFIFSEIKTRMAGIGSAAERRSLLADAKRNFPDDEEFRAKLSELE